jgi:hypothetical protein
MASGSQELDLFIREALLRGHDRAQVSQMLVQAGWSEGQIRQALDNYAAVDFPVPVPKPRASLSAREAFLYLVLFSALYFFSYHLGSLWFSLINHWLPDPADARWQVVRLGPEIRWSVSALLISLPVFTFTARLLAREVADNPIHRLSPVRRWLTYLTLFVAACILIGDLTVLVHKLLGGELNLRFVLKVGVVGLIAGTVFTHYLRDLRQEEQSSANLRRPQPLANGTRLLGAASLLTIAAMACGIWVMGSPAQQRLIRLDDARVADLAQLEVAVERYLREQQQLPATLEVLVNQPGTDLRWRDRSSHQPYGYRPLGDEAIELCAHFATDTARTAHGDAGDWPHPAGQHCFRRPVEKPTDAAVAP